MIRRMFIFLWSSSTLIPCNSSPNFDVIVRGTTVGPNFVRMEELLSVECPMDYPWSFDNGLKCCKTYEGPTPYQDLMFNDASTSCKNDDWVACTNLKRRCRSRVALFTCPVSYPFALVEAGCCQSIVARYDPNGNPPCFGDLLNPFSPHQCCSNFSRVNVCIERQQKCFQGGSIQPDPPTVLEETTLSSADGPVYAKFVLTDCQCDVMRKNFWVALPEGRYFIVDLGYHIIPQQAILRNAHNAIYNDRSTKDFKIDGSSFKPQQGQLIWSEWIELVRDSFPSPSLFGNALCRIPLTKISISTSKRLRYFKFQALSFYGDGATLQFFQII